MTNNPGGCCVADVTDPTAGAAPLPAARLMTLPSLALTGGRAAWVQNFPGTAVALLVGMAAAFLGSHYQGSMLLFALLLGMALNFLTEDKRLAPGIHLPALVPLEAKVKETSE